METFNSLFANGERGNFSTYGTSENQVTWVKLTLTLPSISILEARGERVRIAVHATFLNSGTGGAAAADFRASISAVHFTQPSSSKRSTVRLA